MPSDPVLINFKFQVSFIADLQSARDELDSILLKLAGKVAEGEIDLSSHRNEGVILSTNGTAVGRWIT